MILVKLDKEQSQSSSRIITKMRNFNRKLYFQVAERENIN